MSAAPPFADGPTADQTGAPGANLADADSRYWQGAVASPSFSTLMQTKTRLVSPLLIGSFVFIVAICLLAGYARSFMAIKVVGAFNVGYLLILLTYFLCWAVAVIYVRTANAHFDRQARAAVDALPTRNPL